MQTRGVLFIHSCPRALCQHVEWAVGNVLETQVTMQWIVQPALPQMYRCEFSWSGAVGMGANLASALRGWEHLRYEVTEDASAVSNGARWAYTPDLGIHHWQSDIMGNIVIPEAQVRLALESTDPEQMRNQLELALGKAWDEELESFRYAGTGAPVRWLHHVG